MPINKVKDKNGKLIKKDGKQKYRVRVNYVDIYGENKQIERKVYGLDEAKQIEQELLYSVKKETPAQKLSVSELFKEYINAKKSEIRETTFKKKCEIIEHHVLPYLEKCKLDKLNAKVLQQWKQEIDNVGNLGIGMKKKIYGEFRAMLNFAVMMEYLPKNPLLKVGNFKAPLETHKEMLFYTPEEFGKYITVAKEKATECQDNIQLWNYYVFFFIAFFTGMRKGEIYALTWNDIQEDGIHITKSLSQKLQGEDRITPPKNKSSIRIVQVPEPLKQVLNEHYERCKSLENFTKDYLICGGLTALRDTTVDKMNRKFADLSGVKRIRIHDFRHSHASLLANNGINIQEIARRLGHSDVHTTLQTYYHLYPKESERALKILNDIKI